MNEIPSLLRGAWAMSVLIFLLARHPKARMEDLSRILLAILNLVAGMYFCILATNPFDVALSITLLLNAAAHTTQHRILLPVRIALVGIGVLCLMGSILWKNWT